MVQIALEINLEYDVQHADGADFVFNIHPAVTAHQSVDDENLHISQPVVPQIAVEPSTGSRFMRLHANAGPLVVSYSATVTIDHHLAEPDTLEEVPVRCLPLEVMPYVYPSRYCESDRLLKLAFSEFGGLWPGYSRVLAIQHWVQRRVTFASNTSTSTTSALDTVLDQVGVCRDFTHLMIALCRALNIPARMATGTDYGAPESLGPPDFHAYVEAYLGDRWYLFDPSGTGIPMGFVRIGTGRDAADVAYATIFGAVQSKAPLVRATASTAAGFTLPRHCREALSTVAASPVSSSGCAQFDGATAFTGTSARQLPN
ncbi:transglutaminase-like domain-containing protein [Ramlibacter sp. Leaf400]|uniref:transglutaminase-like domain-containing protein n=1 Tax=Ramlibacter sp. Leaf400 TaxID=1736365 RepID=UPI000A922691|nr:transglutaminase family protein [Ramlibacter sp. Leaf400]